jgi:hypothetical protein
MREALSAANGKKARERKVTVMIQLNSIETVRSTEETVCEPSNSTGIRSSCHDSLLDSDIYDTCLPDLNNYFSLLAKIAGEEFF